VILAGAMQVADAQGDPQRLVIVRHQGMGLDAKALEAVRQASDAAWGTGAGGSQH
jgi:hypothetical protein